MSVTTLAELSGYSKAYISQVKHGKRPPSEKLVQILQDLRPGKAREENKQLEVQKALEAFLRSRREGISPHTIRDYRITLNKALLVLGLRPTTGQINRYLNSLDCSLGGKYSYYKDIRAFYNWLYRVPVHHIR